MNSVKLTINDRSTDIAVAGGETLLTTLREQVGLLGTKEGCLEGECGACTVLLDSKPIDSCIYATAACAGRSITTIEGIGSSDEMSMLQQAFVDAGAVQCGFCTPGFVVTLTALLRENPHPSRSEIQHAVSGNICRCTGYSQIVEAVVAVVEAAKGSGANAGDTDSEGTA